MAAMQVTGRLALILGMGMVHNRLRCFWGRSVGIVGRSMLSVVVLAFGVSAFAAPPPPPVPAAEGESTRGAKTREWVQKGAQKVVEINFEESNADIVYGKVQKPGVDYLIMQGDLSYEGLPMEHDLLQVLEQSVKEPPF